MLQHRYSRQSRGSRAATVLAVTGCLVLAACKPDAPAGSGDPTGPNPPGPEPRFSVMLRWDAPVEDAEGRPLEDLAGYRLYYAPDANAVKTGGSIETGMNAEALVTGLPSGAWHFGVTAVDTAGNESQLSDLVSVEVGGP